jgi:alpha-N-acetylglucosamine transferase
LYCLSYIKAIRLIVLTLIHTNTIIVVLSVLLHGFWFTFDIFKLLFLQDYT